MLGLLLLAIMALIKARMQFQDRGPSLGPLARVTRKALVRAIEYLFRIKK